MDRRRFLTVLGATGGAAAAASACDIHAEPTEHLVPYTVPPENQVPGIATYYATTCRECAAGCGLHAKVREGRVVKLEGNPESPINQGRLCSRGQAGLQGLYNPDRVTDPMARGPNGEWQKRSWEDGMGRLQAKVKEARGKRIVFVTGLESGSFGELVDTWMKQVGGRHVTYEPFAFEALREGNRIAFGTPAIPWYDFANARYIVSFGADFMETWLSPVGYQNGFTRAHAFEGGRDGSMAKFVSVAPRLSLTGMSADEWIAAKPGTEFMLALAMAQVILAERLAPAPADARGLEQLLPAPQQGATLVGMEARDIRRLSREVAASKGGLAVAGGGGAPDGSGAPGALASGGLLDARAGGGGGDGGGGGRGAGVEGRQQRVMRRVFPNTRHTGDVLLQASGRASTFKDYLQTRWRTLHQRYGRGRGFDDFWSDAVQHGGVYADTPAPSVRLVPGIAQRLGGLAGSAGPSEEHPLVGLPAVPLAHRRGPAPPR